MSPQDEYPRPADAIRARAEELARRGEPLEPSEDLDVLASLIEGTVSLDEIDEDTLDRCLQAQGTEHFVQALVAGQDAIRDSPSKEQRPARPWWREHTGWLAAASVAFITTVAIWGVTGGKLQWSALETFNPITGTLLEKNVSQPQEVTGSFQRHEFAEPDTLNVDPSVQNNLEWMYQEGIGLPQDDKEMVALYRKAAEQGDAWGQNHLGRVYQYGRGVPQDDKEAMVWYRKAAEQGDAWGQNLLGRMYQYGRGVPQDDKEAMVWYRKAAEQRNAWGRNHLGWMYAHGDGVPKDDKEAMVWYRKAAEQGDHWGQYHLGEMYQYGRGVPQDDKEAMVWYRKAAEHWNVEAMLRLAESYGSGQGVPQDDLSAYMWYSIAATASSADGKMARDRMGQQLSAKQLQQARELAQRCQDSKFQECR